MERRLKLARGGTFVALMAMLAGSPRRPSRAHVHDVSVEGGEDAAVTASINPEIEAEFERTYQRQVHG
jgi:hypothetical protein